MIGKVISFLALVAVAAAAAVATGESTWVEKPFEGVDPDTLSCLDALNLTHPHGQMHLLLPAFGEGCFDYFYQCDWGKEHKILCPEPLVFDWERQVCNWKQATKCVCRTPLEVEEEVEEEGSGDETEFAVFAHEIENGPVGDLTEAASGTVRPMAALSARQTNNPISLNCNDALYASRQVPYKGDCQRYWKCVAGVPQTFFCSDGLFFNEANMQCDHEANVKCSIQITEELDGEFMVYKE